MAGPSLKLKALTKSIWVFHLAASPCNNCDIEILDALTPRYDLERFGIGCEFLDRVFLSVPAASEDLVASFVVGGEITMNRRIPIRTMGDLKGTDHPAPPARYSTL